MNKRKFAIGVLKYAALFALSPHASWAANTTSQELLPENNASGKGKPVVMFEARAGKVEGGSSGLVGHTFVKLGREIDNGKVLVSSIVGYYPKHGKAYEVKLLFGTPGELKSEIADFQNDISQKYYVSEAKYNELSDWQTKYVINNPEYSLLSGDTCVKFVTAVATEIGLKAPKSGTFTLPYQAVDSIQKLNGTDPKTILRNAQNKPAPKPKRGGRGKGEPDGNERNSVGERMGRDSFGDVPVVRGGMTANSGDEPRGNIEFGYPTVTVIGGGGSPRIGRPPRLLLPR